MNKTSNMTTALMIHKRQRVSWEQPSRLNDLPDFLLAEIFRRLPLTTAHRSKLVCKRWNSVISEPYFAEWFSQTMKPYSLFTVCACGEKEPTLYPDSEFEDSAIAEGLSLNFMKSKMSHCDEDIVFGSFSNDLLLCVDCRTYLVCNPATREWIRIPRDSLSFRRYSAVGFTSKTNGEFAILMLFRLPRFNIKVLYSSTLVWAETNLTCPPRIMHMSFSSTYALSCNDLLFWLDDASGTVIGIDPFDILTKNKNPWLFIEPPKEYVHLDIDQDTTRDYYHSYIGTCRGNLRLCQLIKNGLILRVWDLDDTEWLLYSEVSLQKMANDARFSMPERPRKIECCDPYDPNVIHTTRDFLPWEAVTFNLLTGEIKMAHPCTDKKLWRLIPYKLQWQPSRLLVSNNRMLASCF